MVTLTRRTLLRVAAFAGAGAWLGWGMRPRRGGAPVRRERHLMGSTVHLTVAGPDREAAEAAAEATLDRMAALESLLSRFRPGSEVSRLNTHGVVEAPSPEFRSVLALAREVHALGGGAFDITIQPLYETYRARRQAESPLPSAAEIEAALARVGQRSLVLGPACVRLARPGAAISLDGIAKGFIVDEAAALLRTRGFGNVLVEAGGDLLACGRRARGAPWRVGLLHPRPGPVPLLGRIEAEEVAVATSGDYFQPFTPDLSLHHILDPRTGRSPPELASATVIAPTAARADALATLAMVLGPRAGRAMVEEQPDCEACLVTKGSEVVCTSGFRLA